MISVHFTIRWLLLLMLICAVKGARDLHNKRHQVAYEHFDEFLVGSLTESGQPERSQRLIHRTNILRRPARPYPRLQTTPATDDEDLTEDGSGQEDVENKAVKPRNLLDYFKDVPREHWSCCMLGKLAGDKGFHCHADMYATRIVRRNRNRAHNRKMFFHGRNRIENYGKDLMQTFQRCVHRKAPEFHKCCYAAAVEKRELNRWQKYRARENEAEPKSNENETDEEEYY